MIMLRFLKKSANPMRSNEDTDPASPVPSTEEWKTTHKQKFRPSLHAVMKLLTKTRLLKLDVPAKHLKFLCDVGFLQEAKALYPNVEITNDMINKKLCFKGSGDELNEAYDECSWSVRHIYEKRLTFDDKRIWDTVADSEVEELLKRVLISKKIKAQVYPDKDGESVVITGISGVECEKAQNVLLQMVAKKSIQVPQHVGLQPENLKKFIIEEERNKPLKIDFLPSDMMLEIVGLRDEVIKTESAVFLLFKFSNDKREYFTPIVSEDVQTFLHEHFAEITKPIEEELKSLKVSITLKKLHTFENRICLKGSEGSLPRSKILIEKSIQQIVKQDEKFIFPGIKNLFDQSGKIELERINLRRKVFIKIQPCHGASDLSPKVIQRSATGPPITPKSIYTRYNFTTKEGVKMSCRFGKIEDEMADILVNSATSNLNKTTACGKALASRGGLVYTEACKPHSNIPLWTIVCTPGGNLNCQHVVHAVCGDWVEENKINGENALKSLIRKILMKCNELGVSSLAMPTIGAGKHGFPENVVLKSIREETEKVSADNAGQLSLTDISIIVSEETKSRIGEMMPAQHTNRVYASSRRSMSRIPQHEQRPKQQQPSPSTCPITTSSQPENTIDLQFGSVLIVLTEGDITLHKADAIINVVPKSLKLVDGGEVCRSILKKGGTAVQDELDLSARDSTPYSTIVTSAGNIPNVKNIIHFVLTATDVGSLQASVEQCLHSAKEFSLKHVLIPALGTRKLNISPKSSAHIILGAAKKFSKTNYPLILDIVVFLKNMVPDFKSELQDKSKEVRELQNQLRNSQEAQPKNLAREIAQHTEVNNSSPSAIGPTKNTKQMSTVPRDNCSNAMNISTDDEIILRFVGFKKNVNGAIADVKTFVDGIKAEKKIEKVGSVFRKHQSEMQNLSIIYQVHIKCSDSGDVTVEGFKENVNEFLVKFLDMQRKHDMAEERKKLVEYVQWWYLNDDDWVAFDEFVNGEIETAFREDNAKKFHISIDDESYQVDLSTETMKNLLTGASCNLDRTLTGENCSAIVEKKIEKAISTCRKHPSEVQNLSNIYQVHIKCSPDDDLTVEGLKDNVSEFLLKFSDLQKRHDMAEERKKLKEYVQWWYLSDDDWVAFDEFVNGELETAFREDNPKKFLINIDGKSCQVDLSTKMMKNLLTGVSCRLFRTLSGETFSDDLPSCWDNQPEGKLAHLVTLSTSSQEYKEISTHFKNCFNGRSIPEVKKIQRIQNPGLFGPYQAKKKSMAGRENEMRLFHGTAMKNVDAINGNNFNRNFAGLNGTRYGNGVYFTNDSSFALRYCRELDDSLQSLGRRAFQSSSNRKTVQMYAVKVLVGDFTVGKQGMKVPPPKNDPTNPALLYDSVVNNMATPSIFVIFQDHQCYPEYLITLTCN